MVEMYKDRPSGPSFEDRTGETWEKGFVFKDLEMPCDPRKCIPADSNAPVAYLQNLVADKAMNADVRSFPTKDVSWPTSWNSVLSSDRAVNADWNIPLMADRSFPSDYCLPIFWDALLNAETQKALATNKDIPLEWLEAPVIRKDAAIPLAWRSVLQSDRSMAGDWRIPLAADGTFPVSFPVSMARDRTANIDFSKILPKDASFNFNFSIPVASDRISASDWRIPVLADQVTPLSFPVSVAPNRGLNVDFFRFLPGDLQFNLDFSMPVFEDRSFVQEALKGLAKDAVFPAAWSSVILAITKDAIIFFEFRSGTGADKAMVFEMPKGLSLDAVIPEDWTSTVLSELMGFADRPGLFIWQDRDSFIWERPAAAPLSNNVVIPVEWKILRIVDKQAAMEYLKPASADFSGAIDARKGSIKDAAMPADWLGLFAILKDAVIPINVQGWVKADKLSNAAWGIRLNTDKVVGTEFLAPALGSQTVTAEILKGSGQQIISPVEWSGIILYVIASDSTMPVDFLRSLWPDKQIPFNWGIPLLRVMDIAVEDLVPILRDRMIDPEILKRLSGDRVFHIEIAGKIYKIIRVRFGLKKPSAVFLLKKPAVDFKFN